MTFDIDLVGKVGSMALVNHDHDDIDYNIINSISRCLRPGMIWITSGATEIGRIDYMQRNGLEITGETEEIKADYSAQGQTILMDNYRRFMDSKYSLRQILVEHQHFNDPDKREHLKKLLLRCPLQNAIPVINYNDPVNDEEIRKLEIRDLKSKLKNVVQCVDNDETASQIACLVKPKYLLIMTSVDGIYRDKNDPSTLVREIVGKDVYELIESIESFQTYCNGASRQWANGAKAKLEYIKEPVKNGTTVFIANSRYKIPDVVKGTAPSTKIFVK